MDYKEIKKKSGEIIVFCDFNELLLEATEFQSLDEVEAKCLKSGEHYICHCPFCRAEGHTKHKLYIKDTLDVGYCFVCNRSYIHITDDLRVEYRLPEFSQYTNFGCSWGNGVGPKLPTFLDPKWNLENFKYDFTDSDPVAEKYLAGRHKYLPELAKLLEFKYNNGNVVIPFWYHGEVIYYQIRFSGKSKIKYFFPPVSDKPIFSIDYGQGTRNLIICEGVFDALALLIQAPKFIPVAVLGSHISDYQIEFLREYNPKEILIYMDETHLSQGIAQKIRTKIDYCPINIIPSDGEDPEENLKRRIKFGWNLQWIRTKEEYDNYRIQQGRQQNYFKVRQCNY